MPDTQSSVEIPTSLKMVEPSAVASLSTTASTQRRFVLIDDTKYELRDPSELGIAEKFKAAKYGSMMQRISFDVESLTEISDAELDDMGKGIRWIASKVLIGAENIISQLSDDQALELIAAFNDTGSEDIDPKAPGA